jgi:hypothetical protein
LTYGSKQGAVASKQAQGIVGNTAAGTKQDHGDHLVGDLVRGGSKGILSPHKVETSVNHAQLSTLKPDQAVTIGMRYTGCLQPQSPLKHGVILR